MRRHGTPPLPTISSCDADRCPNPTPIHTLDGASSVLCSPGRESAAYVTSRFKKPHQRPTKDLTAGRRFNACGLLSPSYKPHDP
jgi:hypothetical protein